MRQSRRSRSPRRRRCSMRSRRRSRARWARCWPTVTYLFVTAAAFGSEGYAIYFTNDYLAILSFFAGVVALRQGHWWLAALAAFAGAWAKETAMLIAFVAGFEALRRRGPWSAAIACGIAFAIPTLILRTIYPAPTRAVGMVGHLQDERAFHRLGPRRHREVAARQPEGVAVLQRDALLGLAGVAPHARIHSSSPLPSRSPATSSWPGWWCISANCGTCCPSQSLSFPSQWPSLRACFPDRRTTVEPDP